MDSVLVGITALSLALTIGMGVVLFRTWTLERLRAEARAALVARAADRTEALLAARDAKEAATPLILRAGAAASPELFAAHEAPSPWVQRLAIAGSVALVIGIASLGLASLGPSLEAGEDRAAAAARPVLELRALRHTLDARSIVVSGVVYNPRAAARLSNVTATALVFDARGGLVARGTAGLDYTMLGPGEESRFVIEVPLPGSDVVKYRVSFRDPDGGVIPHVDQRAGASSRRGSRDGENAIASLSALSGSVPWVR
jgi:hypothetical protein